MAKKVLMSIPISPERKNWIEQAALAAGYRRNQVSEFCRRMMIKSCDRIISAHYGESMKYEDQVSEGKADNE